MTTDDGIPQDPDDFPEAPAGFRSGFAALVGRPNVGKSTLLNQLVGEKISIVSPVPQTTRNRILAVVTLEGQGQIAFLDTPGIHKPAYRMNRRMVGTALASLAETDVVVVLVDASEGRGPGDAWVLRQVRDVPVPLILVINKIDRVRKPQLLPMIQAYRGEAEFAEIVPVSALAGTQCDALRAAILAHLPEGPPLFPTSYLTDQPERVLAAEIVREKAFLLTRQEVPHAMAVRVDRFQEDGPLIRIEATILVEREGQKGILIGKGGEMLKSVGTAARQDIEKLLAARVFLQLWVRVEPAWRNRGAILDEIGISGPEKAPTGGRGGAS